MAEIITSNNDVKRKYRHVRLANGLDVLLVSDPETEKASCCCDVRVGSLQDPPEAPGLAHFLEHLLFMGTEKYPVENAYSAFLNEHGGSSNAYTSQENTVYFFDVLSDSLEGALDMFASFFVCPLFNQDSTDKEINAVDSENSKNLQNDSWRFFQLFKSMARADHPFNGFSTGNKETLGREGLATRDLCIAFHKKYYSANIMKVCMYGRESLDVLQSWAEAKFLPVENKQIQAPSVPRDPFPPTHTGRLIEVVPIREQKSLSIYFPIPPCETLYLSKPTQYLAHLIGHESAGSILSALKAAGLANGLSAYSTHDTSAFAVFCVGVELTDLGVANYSQVIATVFAYIGMLKREGPKDWIAQEIIDTRAMDFRFLSADDPINYTVYLANNMQTMLPQHYVAGGKLVFEKKPELSSSFLECMRPDNMIIFLGHKGLTGKTTLKEKWYGTDHNLRQLSEAERAFWGGCLEAGRVSDGHLSVTTSAADSLSLSASSEQGGSVNVNVSVAVTVTAPLALPQPNAFIPTDFTLYTTSNSSGSPDTLEATQKGLEVAPVVLKEVSASVDGILERAQAKQSEKDAKAAAAATAAAAASPEGTDGAPAAAGGNEEDEEDEEDDDEGEEGGGSGSGVALPEVPSRSVLLWHKPDTVWKVPKVNCTLLLESPNAFTCPLSVAFTELFASCLKEILSEYSYYADCAGLWFEIYPCKGGLQASFSGFSHKMPVLVERLAQEMARMCRGSNSSASSSASSPDAPPPPPGTDSGPAVSEALFGRMKEKLLRQFSNYKFYTPYNHNSVNSYLALEEPRWSSQDKILAVHGATLADFTAFCSSLLTSMRAVILVHGNATAASAQKLADIVTETLKFQPMPDNQQVHRRVVDLRPGVQYTLRSTALTANPDEPNSCCSNCYYWPAVGAVEAVAAGLDAAESIVRTEAVLELLVQILAEPAFDQLRTKEQLGYIVWTRSSYSPNLQHYLACIVQSSHKAPEFLDERIEAFLTQHFAVVSAFTPEALAVHTQAAVEKLLERPKNLDEETRRLWQELQDGRFLFDLRQRACTHLRQLSVADVVAAYSTFLLPSARRVKWSAHFYGKGHAYPAAPTTPHDVPTLVVSEPSAFRRSQPLQPLLDLLSIHQAKTAAP